jgi:hypothetical protein
MSPVVWTCKRFHVVAAVGMLVVLLLLPLLSAMNNGEFDHGGGGGGGGGPAATIGCIFLQESSGFLCFPFLWRFFHRNDDSCSAVTFSERHHQETCLYGAYVESYVGYQLLDKNRVRYKSMVLHDGFCPPPSLRRLHHCCTAIAASPPPLPPPLLRPHRLCRRCAA